MALEKTVNRFPDNQTKIQDGLAYSLGGFNFYRLRSWIKKLEYVEAEKIPNIKRNLKTFNTL